MTTDLHANALKESNKKLGYVIHKCSSSNNMYAPGNIKEDKFHDQSSRWSSDSNNPPQYITLKLENYCIVECIKFGKYEKTHVCNLKRFKVYGGMTDDANMMELLESGLKNDSTAEVFQLRHVLRDQAFPCRYIKIMPLESWGPSFNFSIWYVELIGCDDWTIVKPAIDWLSKYRERELVRLCLKHFRQQNYLDAYDALARQTQVYLEDSRLSELHESLVTRGDYDGTEGMMQQYVTNGLFDQYINQQEYRPVWSPIPADPVARPGMRGGHQMSMDPHTDTIYMFGGWDGNQDLSDLWSYNVPDNTWALISRDTELEGGPSARSCHKLCIDPERRQIFTLGRYLDTQYRLADKLKSDFFMYDIDSNRWTLISEDTGLIGGPQLIFDHQMCMDTDQRTIYVFGGRVLVPTNENSEERSLTGQVAVVDPIFSGLFSYHVPTNTWTKLCDDCIESSTPGSATIWSRVGHSMLFHPGFRSLFIFAGQRSKDYLNDFFTYNVDTHKVTQISGVAKNESNVPAAGFTQRATIDPERNEIYVLSGLSKDKEKREGNVQNSFWVYSINQDSWSCIYRNENTGVEYWKEMQLVEPCPRFAHQLVYDPVKKVHYLFGGNPGKAWLPKLRLDDFWQLLLRRPTRAQLLQKCRLLIRKHRLEEIATKDKLSALEYLQTSIGEIIDHECPEETKEFQLLASVLFRDHEESTSESGSDADCHQKRSLLYDQLSSFFPDVMTQPRGNLADLLQL